MITPHISSATWQDHTSAILSGFLGDWLEHRANPLAVDLQIRHQSLPLCLAHPQVDGPERTLIVMVHGLTELESIWDYPGKPGINYGTQLADMLDATPLCLRYNSGRAIYRNGEALSEALDTLVTHWPVPVEKLILVGHSMGGLLIRSACHAGTRAERGWTALVDSCVYLGSPHEGSWLAKAAHSAAGLMNRQSRDYLKAVGDVLDLRSEGIRNLSRGEVLSDQQDMPPLLPGARHFAISGLLANHPNHPVNKLFGDALVLDTSARGTHQPGWQLTATACFPGLDHIRLTHHDKVYQQLKEWLA
ncbi:MAG: hypothetical protein WD623_00130 [Marinobacter sp.]|uniref:esterase/lipase family protein n=1 Tax=Marinobacter sp. TaxID=50741 RepID=UPI0034A08549